MCRMIMRCAYCIRLNLHAMHDDNMLPQYVHLCKLIRPAYILADVWGALANHWHLPVRITALRAFKPTRSVYEYMQNGCCGLMLQVLQQTNLLPTV